MDEGQADMSEHSKIAWTHHTFNPWWGCTKVSAGCANCYAEAMAARRWVRWGDGEPRRFFDDQHWREPLRWNRRAERAGQRARVFCGSMCDVFERDGHGHIDDDLHGARMRLYDVIEETPWLDWLLLTKRPENFAQMLPWVKPPANVWLGVTAEDQERADERIPLLLETPAAVRFVSCEPLLGPVDLGAVRLRDGDALGPGLFDRATGTHLDWVIVGGESGPRARPCCAKWIRDIIGQCRAAGTSCFVKQLGAITDAAIGIRDRAAADPAEWPEDLRVREMPEVQP
jgi:protein gp37